MLLIILLVALANCKLSYVATVFRHGARYPLKDVFDGNETREFHGRLTTVGLRQQFLLGGYLKADYIDKAKLINATLFPKEVEVFTDSSQRCVESAIAHLVGLFPFGTGSRLPENVSSDYLKPPFESILSAYLRRQEGVSLSEYALKLGFQPVSYIYAFDFFPSCPNEAKLIAKRIQSQSVRLAEFQLVNAPFTEKMRIVFNLKTEYANVLGLSQLYDVVICDLNLGRQMPSQFTDYDYQQLKYIQNYLFVFLYEGSMASIYSTKVMAGILQNMDNIVQKGEKQVKKYSIYSAHDTNVVPLLVFLNLTSSECIEKKWKNQTFNNGNCGECPPFASNLVFQLHQDDTDSTKHLVKLRYNGEYYRMCETSAKECEYQEFARRVRAQFVDVNKQCGIAPQSPEPEQNQEPQLLIQ